MSGRYITHNHVHPNALGMECLPCPFCASTRLGVYMGRTYHVTCGHCGTDGPVSRCVAEACSTWNNRASKEQTISSLHMRT